MPIQNQTSETVIYTINNGGETSGDLRPGETEDNQHLTALSLVTFYSTGDKKLKAVLLPAYHNDPPSNPTPTNENTIVWIKIADGVYDAGYRYSPSSSKPVRGQ